MTPYYSDESVTLYHGDALAVLASLPDASVDALVTDPPYSSGGMVRSDRAGSDTRTKYSGYMGKKSEHVRSGGVALLFTDWRQLPTTTDALQAGGYVWRGIVPWSKPTSRPTSGRFTASCEYVVWGSAGPMPTDDLAAPCFPGFYQASAPRDREHLTQKPISVMRDLVKIAPKGGTVLDPFMGSGTTGIAAVLEGRHFIGCELTEHYAEIAQRRIVTARQGYRDDGSQGVLLADDEGGAA